VTTQPQVGDYGLVDTGSRIVGPLIKLFTRSPVDHAVVYIGNGFIVEAETSGAVISPVARYKRVVWSRRDLTSAQRERVRLEALKLRGTPYSFLDLAALAWSTFGLPMPVWVWNRLARPDRLICSQLVAVAYQRAGVVLVPGVLSCQVTPGLLLADDVLGL